MAAAAVARLNVDVGPQHRPDGASLVPVMTPPARADGADASSSGQSHGASLQAGRSPDGVDPAATAPAIPRDLLLAIARTALAAEGHSLQGRVRLSLVCRAWRRELAGEPLTHCL